MLLSARLGDVVPLEDLSYVLPKKESTGRRRARSPQLAVARRIRELRESGWQVQRGKDGTRAGLASSGYPLGTLGRIPEYGRMRAGQREAALRRAGYTCEHCGWLPSHGASPGKKRLEVHHKSDPQRSRAADVHRAENLEVLCNLCHAGVERRMKRSVPRHVPHSSRPAEA